MRRWLFEKRWMLKRVHQDAGQSLNLMGDAPASEMEWNEPFFRDCFDNVDKVVTWVSRKGNPFARHQTIARSRVWRPGLRHRFQ
jgi:hypothetical protein